MKRPHRSDPDYESDKDRFAEKKFADLILQRSGAELIKLPKYYIVDFAVKKKGKIIGFAEYKRRYVNSDKYPTIILAITKWMKLCDYSQHGGAWFWIEYDDCVKWIEADTSLDLDILWSGRIDRGDEADEEPCVHIPIEMLKRLSTC